MLTAVILAGQVAVTSAADDLPLVDGTLWTQSSSLEKRTYLIGVGNLLDVEYAYQIKSGQPPSDDQTVVPRLYRGLDGMSLNEVIMHVDEWYERNPEQLDRAVLEVVWIKRVEPQDGGDR